MLNSLLLGGCEIFFQTAMPLLNASCQFEMKRNFSNRKVTGFANWTPQENAMLMFHAGCHFEIEQSVHHHYFGI